MKEQLLPFARLTFGHKFGYQNDKARPHRARTVVNFMETEGIERQNMAELRQAVIDAWQALPLQNLATLIGSMPR